MDDQGKPGPIELALVGTGHAHLIALRQVSVEVIAPVGLNLGGDLESHVVELGLAGRVLVALGDLDVYFEASTALLPDSSTQALLVGASWRVR